MLMFIPTVFLACSRATPAAGPPPTTSVVVLVRHAEKEMDGSRDPSLTLKGVARANCLADQLESFAPERLLATEYTRTQSTLGPLAGRVGKSVEALPAGDETVWLAALRTLPPGSRVVVAGHSNTVPALIAGLGGTVDGLDDKGYIPEETYDRMFRVTLEKGAARDVEASTYCAASSPAVE